MIRIILQKYQDSEAVNLPPSNPDPKIEIREPELVVKSPRNPSESTGSVDPKEPSEDPGSGNMWKYTGLWGWDKVKMPEEKVG